MNRAITCRSLLFVAMLGMLTLAMGACSDYKQAQGDHPHESLQMRAEATVDAFKRTDPSLSRFFETAAGYAVFPEIAKGAAGVGAAHGHGVVFEKIKSGDTATSQPVGRATMSQGTLGLQLGGQTYSELIFFEDQESLNTFKAGETEFSAQASAVAAAKGAAANADYANGVAIFTRGQQGLMFEASVGGQKFDYMAYE